MAFLQALPGCQSIEDVLHLTVLRALVLTAGTAAVALAESVPPPAITAGAPDADLLGLAHRAWQSSLDQGESAVTFSANSSANMEAGVLLVPLAPADELYGVLALRLPTPATAAQRQILQLMARAAGERLHLQISLARMTERMTELSMLYEVATALDATLDLPELLTLIVERTQAALRSDACTLMLMDDTTRELVFAIPTGAAGAALQQFRVPISEGICGWVARTARPAVVNSPRDDSRFDPEVDETSGFHTRSVLCVPLLVRGRVIGVLEVLNKLNNELYSPHDLNLLTTLAGQAAVAIDNAQLYTSLQAEHSRFLEVEDQVRKELARDLHDGPAQQMAAMVMQVEVLRKLLDRDPSRFPEELDALEALAHKANRQVRTLQFQLRPVMLETRGLRAAIEYYVNQLRETEPARYSLDVTGCTGRLPAHLERASFDIVQEALGNIRKHAAARHVTVRMWRQVGRWIIKITDDGKGFDVAATLRSYETRGSLGLLNMRERAQAMGGDLDITSTPGEGTTVTLEIPTEAYIPIEDSMTIALEIPPDGLQM